MDGTQTANFYGCELEAEILGQIVDAMLDSESELKHASMKEWRSILVDSCRRQKSDLLAATC
jgi:hypothetical protein